LEAARLTSASWIKYSCTSLQLFSMRYGGTLLGLFSVTWMEPAAAEHDDRKAAMQDRRKLNL
jgi:hypothetical protein